MKPFHTSLRVLTHQECLEILSRNTFGHLGCTDGNDCYVVPMSYVFEDGLIYCHSREGKKLEYLRTDLPSCLQVEEIIDYYHWRSVTAICSYEEVRGEETLRFARLIINRLTHSKKIAPLEEDFATILETSVVFRFHIQKTDGRHEGSSDE